MVEFPSNGSSAQGWFAPSATGSGPGILVIQEWWGLVPHIQEVVDRFASEGFTALAPDLYHGEATTEPDEAGKLMMALNLEQAAKDLRGAIAFLKGSEATSSEGVGVVGYCMGGGLALVVACNEPQDVVACAPYYGLIPWEGAAPDYSKLSGPVHGHYAENDDFFSPALAKALETELRETHGKDAVLEVHPDVDHAFFNDHRPEVHSPEEADKAFAETVAFFRRTVR
ncbi:dienelactone hydrolase family protein [Dermatobacter hominis]|uniref:dienelactone hydrolase family protein n=1 Tax=Dermatobacter hominis TaxID=2884263 RepID=UPI001D0F6543|nr:dienelactone hydrolase family protein [Dermatobacter hominis]UDY37348.1 dienelactone hydrolase family protein [Dermatobacter hominis]